MRAYYGAEAVKAMYLEFAREWREANRVGPCKCTWRQGRGSVVGCLQHGRSNAQAYEEELGIPVALARLHFQIFDGLPSAKECEMEWPESFLGAINLGADLSKVGGQFAAWLLDDSAQGMIRFAQTDATRQAIAGRANLYRTECTDEEQWRASDGACIAAAIAAKQALWMPHCFGADHAWTNLAALAKAAANLAGDSAADDSPGAMPEMNTWFVANAAYVCQAEKLLELLKAA